MTGKGIRRRICWLFVNHLLPQGVCFEARRKLLNWAGYPVGSGTRIAGAMHVTTELSIGSDCWIGRNFTCHGNGSVTIGDRCDIAPDVTVATGSHELGGADRRAGQGYNCSVTVGSGCWLGVRSTLLGGAAVADGCVVAACALVKGATERNTMMGGVPARLLRRLPDEE